jgi:hypothetical protein
VAAPPDRYPLVVHAQFVPASAPGFPVSLTWVDDQSAYVAAVGGNDLKIVYNAASLPAWSSSFGGASWSLSDLSPGFSGLSTWDPSSSALCTFLDVDFGDAYDSLRIGWLIGCGYALGWSFIGMNFFFVWFMRNFMMQSAGALR